MSIRAKRDLEFHISNAPSELARFSLLKADARHLKICDCDARPACFRMASIWAPGSYSSAHGSGWWPHATCDGCTAYGCGRHSHPPNPGQSTSPTDPPIALQSFTRDAPFPRWRWRDAVFEDPFGRSHGWIKFAEPRSDRPCGFTIAEQQAAIHFQLQTYAEICDAA